MFSKMMLLAFFALTWPFQAYLILRSNRFRLASALQNKFYDPLGVDCLGSLVFLGALLLVGIIIQLVWNFNMGWLAWEGVYIGGGIALVWTTERRKFKDMLLYGPLDREESAGILL